MLVAERIGVDEQTVRGWQERFGSPPQTDVSSDEPTLQMGTTTPAAASDATADADNKVARDAQRNRPGHLSPSGSATFEQCPRRWKLRYVDALADPPGVAAQIGSFAHLVLQLLLDLPAPQRDVQAARRVAAEQWPGFAADEQFVGLSLDPTAVREFKWAAWRAIEGLWQIEDPADVDVAGTEQQVDTDLAGVPFRGIVDRLERRDGELVVTDYKSGRAPSRGYSGRHMHQLMLYAAAIAAANGEMPAEVRVCYLGQREVSSRVTGQLLDEAVSHLADTWASINSACETGRFEPRTGPLCGWCPYTGLCPEGAAAVAERAAEAAVRGDAVA